VEKAVQRSAEARNAEAKRQIEARRAQPLWHSLHSEACRTEAKFWVWLFCLATLTNAIPASMIPLLHKLSCEIFFGGITIMSCLYTVHKCCKSSDNGHFHEKK